MSAQRPELGARAAVGLPLLGRYQDPAGEAAQGLRVWAERAGATLEVIDTGDEPDRIAAVYSELADRADLLFGPYGSGPLRAAQRGLQRSRAVMWNHGGAAGDSSSRARVIDVLGPAESYWAGLPTVLAQKGIDRSRVAVAHAPTGFGERTAAGAVAALEKVGFSPVAVSTFDDGSASALASALIALEASAVIACGHIEDDLALMESLPPGSMAVGSIVAGIDLARERLGDRVLGCFGPAQWFPTHEHPLAQDAQYPAAQAYAAGEVAQAAAAAAESFDPDRLWNAAIGLRMRTLIGPFEVEEDGKQRAHSPLLVEWAQTSEGPKRRVIWQP